MDDKRGSPRLHTIRLVAYARLVPGRPADAMGVGNTLDVSEGGLRMALYEPLAEGERVDLEFTVDDQLVHATAKVMHVEEVKQYVVGLQFEGDIAPGDLEQLRRYVPPTLAPPPSSGEGD